MLYLPSRIPFQVTPGAISARGLARRLYNDERIGPYLYPHSPYGLEGLGFDYYDLLDQAGRESCDPKDSACVGRNQQRQVAVEDLWLTYSGNSSIANQPAPTIHINTDNSQAATAAFMANQPMTSETIQVGSGPVYSDAYYETLHPTPPPPVPVAPKPNQSVPPTTQILPMATGFQNTAAVIAGQPASGIMRGSMDQTPALVPDDSKILGMDQKTFLMVAAAGAAALFFMGRR